MHEQQQGLIGGRIIEQFDGAPWRIFELGSSGAVLLTHEGNKLLTNKSIPNSTGEATNILHILHEYRLLSHSLKEDDKIRKFIAGSGNGAFYSIPALGRIGVKEISTTQSAYHSLLRMDRIYSLMQHHDVPPWLKVPLHYGAVIHPNLNKQYLIMEKIDNGLSVQDILYGPRFATMEDTYSELLESHPEIVHQVRQQYECTEQILRSLTASSGEKFKDVFTDFQEGNVLIDVFSDSVRNSNICFWIIDQ